MSAWIGVWRERNLAPSLNHQTNKRYCICPPLIRVVHSGKICLFPIYGLDIQTLSVRLYLMKGNVTFYKCTFRSLNTWLFGPSTFHFDCKHQYEIGSYNLFVIFILVDMVCLCCYCCFHLNSKEIRGGDEFALPPCNIKSKDISWFVYSVAKNKWRQEMGS